MFQNRSIRSSTINSSSNNNNWRPYKHNTTKRRRRLTKSPASSIKKTTTTTDKQQQTIQIFPARTTEFTRFKNIKKIYSVWLSWNLISKTKFSSKQPSAFGPVESPPKKKKPFKLEETQKIFFRNFGWWLMKILCIFEWIESRFGDRFDQKKKKEKTFFAAVINLNIFAEKQKFRLFCFSLFWRQDFKRRNSRARRALFGQTTSERLRFYFMSLFGWLKGSACVHYVWIVALFDLHSFSFVFVLRIAKESGDSSMIFGNSRTDDCVLRNCVSLIASTMETNSTLHQSIQSKIVVISTTKKNEWQVCRQTSISSQHQLTLAIHLIFIPPCVCLRVCFFSVFFRCFFVSMLRIVASSGKSTPRPQQVSFERKNVSNPSSTIYTRWHFEERHSIKTADREEDEF